MVAIIDGHLRNNLMSKKSNSEPGVNMTCQEQKVVWTFISLFQLIFSIGSRSSETYGWMTLNIEKW